MKCRLKRFACVSYSATGSGSSGNGSGLKLATIDTSCGSQSLPGLLWTSSRPPSTCTGRLNSACEPAPTPAPNSWLSGVNSSSTKVTPASKVSVLLISSDAPPVASRSWPNEFEAATCPPRPAFASARLTSATRSSMSSLMVVMLNASTDASCAESTIWFEPLTETSIRFAPMALSSARLMSPASRARIAAIVVRHRDFVRVGRGAAAGVARHFDLEVRVVAQIDIVDRLVRSEVQRRRGAGREAELAGVRAGRDRDGRYAAVEAVEADLGAAGNEGANAAR